MQNHSVINVENSINSGQVFLWKKNNTNWYGINGQDILKITNSGNVKSYQNVKTENISSYPRQSQIMASYEAS